MKIQGKHFVITGGGSGLGAATAEYLVEKGASVTLVDMNVEAGEQQAQFPAAEASKVWRLAQFGEGDTGVHHTCAFPQVPEHC